jgi:hypothetical protein
MGATLKCGFDGQMITALSDGLSRAARTAAAIRARDGVYEGAYRVIAHRCDAVADAQACAQRPGDGGEALPGAQPPRALHMGGEVAVTDAEPGLSAQCLQALHEIPGFCCDTPAPRRIADARQRVHHRVQIRGNIHPQMLEVVPCVDDNRQFLGSEHIREALGELRSSNAAGKREDHGSPSS